MKVAVAAGGLNLGADLVIPVQPTGLVIFAHGSGSSRHSPRNRFVAAGLNERGLATLLLDLLAPGEEGDRRNVFDIELITARLAAATAWTADHADLTELPIGYFGASTGAAAALAASVGAGRVGAVVSRGGRTDLAPTPERVAAPTLLIVGGADEVVLRLNEETLRLLGGPAELLVVPGAGHLFAEPGALEQVTSAAGKWFATHLGGTGG